MIKISWKHILLIVLLIPLIALIICCAAAVSPFVVFYLLMDNAHERLCYYRNKKYIINKKLEKHVADNNYFNNTFNSKSYDKSNESIRAGA